MVTLSNIRLKIRCKKSASSISGLSLRKGSSCAFNDGHVKWVEGHSQGPPREEASGQK